MRERLVSAGGDADSAKKTSDETDKLQSRYKRQRAEALKEPLVRRTVEVLGAQLVEVDEGFGATSASSPERDDEPDREEHEA